MLRTEQKEEMVACGGVFGAVCASRPSGREVD